MIPPLALPGIMYHDHYGLARMPFQGAPDPDFLYLGAAHREALAALEYGIEAGMGFVMLTGDVGLGKTTLIRSYLQQSLPADSLVIYIYHPVLSFRALLAAIAEELGLPGDEPDPHLLVRRIQRELIGRFAGGQRVVLVIDEAQRLPEDTLENLRLISNLETNQSKLLQIAMVGQPELEKLLTSPGLRALDQRVGLRARLKPLSRSETEAYIRHRLSQAGAADPESVIEPAAMRLIARRSGGVPRRINTIADLALIHGFGNGQRPVGKGAVRAAGRPPGQPAALYFANGTAAPPPQRTSFAEGAELAYVVTERESVETLARRLYGSNASQAIGVIARNNPGLDAQSLLSDGQVLFLPMPAKP